MSLSHRAANEIWSLNKVQHKFLNCRWKGGFRPPAPPPGSPTVKGRGFKQFSLGIVKFMRERSVVWRNDTNHYFECGAWPIHVHGKTSTLQIYGYCRNLNMLNVGALTEPNSRELTQEALSSRTMMENWWWGFIFDLVFTKIPADLWTSWNIDLQNHN